MGEFDTTLGALVVAYCLAWGLFGLMSMQSFNYFQKFVKDSWWLKGLVGILWALDTLQLVLIGDVLYYWVITNYNDPAILAVSTWSFNIGIAVTNLIVFIVELFLARRVYILSNNNILLTGIIVLLSTLYFGFELAVQVRTFQLKEIRLFFEFQWIASVGLACAAAADLLIAISLSCYLLRSCTGIKTTDSIVNKLILYAMNTGLLTVIIVLIDMICFLTMPKNLLHIAFNLVAGKLYTNSLLASLNFRDTIRNSASDINTFSLSGINSSSAQPSYKFRNAPHTHPDTLDTHDTLNITTLGARDELELTRTHSEMKFSHAV
ncbi:hypothetical protein C8F04DRAFT_1269546 [Mycena alexandri]|uniref:DUF6534 domain-containing protein n=1 Tax=Mycena alexandri TaxID=1745969 RepID=A0AAD6WVT7_9AGAR|nr:hypothetical protein C8F04DRAFT_1269546 [Mycena alexandri]